MEQSLTEAEDTLTLQSSKQNDHAYIKSEIEDGEVFMDDETGNFKLYIGDGSDDIDGEAEGEIHPDDPPEVHVKVEMEEEEEDESMDG